ncbi:MAG: helix-turn-helix domain containing protein [Actinomycetota bacterium]|nr:helix-turn-helix domain containing protein [Actinomycetota bacterium]MDD5667439.1 helix-turn-helix domain containing protein [Actinomycetota bacterium]
MEAAYRVISEKGYHRTRIEDIAQETGMAQGLFYRYFENKKDVFSQIIDMVIARISEGVMADAPGTSGTLEEYAEQMKRGLDNLFDILVEDPFISKLLFHEAQGIDEEMSRKAQKALDLFADFSSFYIKDGIAKGFLRPDIEIRETAYAFNAVVFEGARRIALSKDKGKAKKSWTKAILDLMIEGTAAPQAQK